MTRPLDIAALREMLEKATPGEWVACRDNGTSWVETSAVGQARFVAGDIDLSRNATLIVALVNAAPELLRCAEEWEEMRAFLGRVRGGTLADEAHALLDRIAKREGGGT